MPVGKILDCVRRAFGFGVVRHRVDRRPDGGAVVSLYRTREKSGSHLAERRLFCGPNHVHAYVNRSDGSLEDLGVSTNLLTNIGRDWWSAQWGFIPTAQNAPATATGATSLTGTGTTWTASNLTTPQLGCAGLRVYAPVTGLTTAPVYGNIVSNTTSVLTLDQWWTAADGVGASPAATNSFVIAPGGLAAARFVGLTTNASAASAADTALASELTTSNLGRALATYAHTFGASSLTLSHTWSPSGTVTNIHKAGMFAALTSAGADPLLYSTVLNADASVASGDSLSVTWTVNPSG